MAKKPNKTKKILTPEQKKAKQEELKQKRIEKKYRRDVAAIFLNAGFSALKVENIEIQFQGRTGELDHLFLYENIIVLCEDTYTTNIGPHLFNKKVLYDHITAKPAEFIEFLRSKFEEFATRFKAANYQAHQYEIKIAYASRYDVSEEHSSQCPNINFISYPLLRYFLSLGKTTGRTSKYEIFKFFNLNLSDIGAARIKGGLSHESNEYQGFLLPETHSNYPKGFKVLSFYIDPETLLKKSYVLRKDSWQDPSSSYQRMLELKKIRSMRKYLAETERVFVNNLIVTLPPSTSILKPGTKLPFTDKELLEKQHVFVKLPNDFNTIGLIDGQHRVYSYHEGDDSYETALSSLRTCQNLLVTAILYPSTLSDLERTKFEATLFLEINDEQTKAKGELKQAIEMIVRPFSTTAISKAIISKLAKKGPLAGLLSEHYFDDEIKLKTSSIVSYGLKPLVKFDGSDSIMNLWVSPKKDEIRKYDNKDLLHEYIDLTTAEINKLLIAFKMSVTQEQWSRKDPKKCVLTPTSINGFIVCLRELIRTNKTGEIEYYKQKMVGLDKFPFSDYTSSHWKALGTKIYETYFN